MSYEVIARKWRPQQFDDVVGQGHVTQTLRNAIETDRVAHAYLFVGPRGTGKTTTARILAKALNCEKGPTATPCDTCDSCREIMAGSHLDVLEIDGASNTGVDHVRELRENVKFAPARGPFKLYIIDEVHMLSTGAFNALLKTLEEPPKHVKFLFATTEPQKIPATILSRCQRFDLRRISTKEIVGRLSEIAEAEGVDIDPTALLAIARGAEGGMRDAQSALDQLIAFRGKEIREADVLSVFGLVAQKTLDDLVAGILAGDVPRIINVVAELDGAGKDMPRLVIELLEYVRNILVLIYAGAEAAGLELTELQLENLKRFASATDPARLLRIVDILMDTDNRMRFALSRRTILETALIRSARAATVVSIDEVLAHLNELKATLGDAPAVTAAAPVVPAAAPPPPPEPPATAPAAGEAPPPTEKPVDSEGNLTLLMEKWHDVIEDVGKVAPLARNYLRDAKPVRIETDEVLIGFDPEFAENKGKIDHQRNRKAIEKTLGSMLGRSVRVAFCVLNTKDTLPGDTKFTPTEGSTESIPRAADPEKNRAAAKTRDEWVKNPAVQRVLEMFNGDIVDIRE